MGFITPQRFGADYDFVWGGAVAAANPQLKFFENFPGHLGQAIIDDSGAMMSVHAVNIPLSISLNGAFWLGSHSAGAAGQSRTITAKFGLYSLNAGTLSLANSASGLWTFNSVAAIEWIAMTDISSTQNITPGTWYFAWLKSASGDGVNDLYYGNSSINPGNAIPGGFLMGRQTATTAAFPTAIATSDLDITGSDAIRQQYVIITA